MSRSLTIQQQAAVLDSFASGVPIKRLAKAYGVDRNTIARVIDGGGLSRPGAAVYPEPIRRDVADSYRSGVSIFKLAKSHRMSRPTIVRILAEQGVALRGHSEATARYKIRHDAFDAITEESAYWAGFLMADGCVTCRRGCSYVLTLNLGRADESHVRRFAAFLGTDAPVRLRRDGMEASIALHSKQIFDALARFGLTPRKSLTAEVKLLERDRHFWRGMIDGDGFVTFTRMGQPMVGLVGSFRSIDQFAEYVRSICPECKTRVETLDKIARFRVSGVYAARLAEELYGDCVVALDRKHETARRVIAYRDRRMTSTLHAEGFDRDTLDNLHRLYGSWPAVARAIGVTFPTLSGYRRHRGMQPKRASRAQL